MSLTRATEGGFVPVGYVAGIPFPQPDKDPSLEPYEIFYNTYYHYAPRLQRNLSCNYISDSYGHFTQFETGASVYSQLAHLSDSGFPQIVPGSNRGVLVKYYQQITPEQGKYATSLDISYADVTRLDKSRSIFLRRVGRFACQRPHAARQLQAAILRGRNRTTGHPLNRNYTESLCRIKTAGRPGAC